MNKKTRLLLVLLAVLVVFCGAYFAIRYIGEKRAEAAAEAERAAIIYVCQINDVDTISYSSDLAGYTFKLAGEWMYVDDPAFPLDQGELGMLAFSLRNMKAIRIVENPESLAAYGLEDPIVEFTASNAAGESIALSFGNASSDGNYYVMRTGEPEIYVVPATVPQQLVMLNDLYALPAIYYAGNIIDAFDVSGTLLPANNVSGLAGDESAAVKSLDSAWRTLELSGCEAYQATPEQISAYGFDDPALTLTITYDTKGSTKLTIGNLDEEIKCYYCRIDDSNDIFLLSHLLVNSLVQSLNNF